MAVSQKVTDPEILDKLKVLKENKEKVQFSVVSTGSPLTKVTDTSLLSELDAIKTKRVKQEQGLNGEPEKSIVREGSTLEDIFETTKTIGSSIIAEPSAGLAGLATYAGTGGDLDRAVDAIEETRDFLTYTPKTTGSEGILQGIGETLSPVVEGFEKVSSTLGDTAYEITDSPEIAAIAYTLPVAALEILGLKGFRRLSEADVRQAQKVALNDPELKYSGSVAEVKLNNKGQLVEDKIGKTLVKNGVTPNETAVITNSTPSTKRKMSEMVNTFEAGKGNDIVAMTDRTTNTIGDSVTARLSALQIKRSSLGKRLDRLVEGDVGKISVDVSDTLEDIVSSLKKENVNLVIKKGKVSLPKNWEKNTVFGVKNMSPAKAVIEDVISLYNIDTTLGQTSVKNAHKLKKNLDKLVSTAELSKGNSVILDVVKMRKKVNDSLKTVDEYNFINKELSEIIETMNPFNKFLKPGQSWSDAKVSSVVGDMMKNLSTEAGSVEMISDLSLLERTLKSKNLVFKDDPRALIAFRKTLLDNFKVDPALVSENMLLPVGGLATSLSIGNVFGAAHDVKHLVSSGMKKKTAKNLVKQRQKAFNTIKMAVNK